MLRELNSIATGLLGLHGYPVRTFSASEATPAKESAAANDEGAESPDQVGENACKPAKPLHSRPNFAW